jgi:hypothetical protein
MGGDASMSCTGFDHHRVGYTWLVRAKFDEELWALLRRNPSFVLLCNFLPCSGNNHDGTFWHTVINELFVGNEAFLIDYPYSRRYFNGVYLHERPCLLQK